MNTDTKSTIASSTIAAVATAATVPLLLHFVGWVGSFMNIITPGEALGGVIALSATLLCGIVTVYLVVFDKVKPFVKKTLVSRLQRRLRDLG